MATGADTAAESDVLFTQSISRTKERRFLVTYRSRVHSHTVILVVHIGARDNHISTATDIETVGIVTTLSVTSLIVDGHIGDSKSIAAVDANSLNRGVLNVKVRDGRGGKIMGIEELWLSLATVATFAVPPTRSVGVKVGTAGALDGNASTRDLEEWTVPFLVSPGGLTLEDHLSRWSEHWTMLNVIGKLEENILTVVSSARLLRSRVVPDGTATSDRMMVEQEACDLLAEAAPEEPEKVQEVARFAKLGASVMAGSATGEAMTPTAKAATKKEPKSLAIASGGLGLLSCCLANEILLGTAPRMRL